MPTQTYYKCPIKLRGELVNSLYALFRCHFFRKLLIQFREPPLRSTAAVSIAGRPVRYISVSSSTGKSPDAPDILVASSREEVARVGKDVTRMDGRTDGTDCICSITCRTGPSLWNSLPVALRDRDISLEQFRRLLKTLWFV